MDLVKAMSPTVKGLKAAKTDGGYFYFVSDLKGENAALMVFDKGKDADGQKTARTGRGLLKDFKSVHGKAVFSEGELLGGTVLTFVIEKGNAKPAVMKRAFKESNLLHDGVGQALVALLKAAKFQMKATEETGADEAPSTGAPTTPTVAGPSLEDWRARPEVQDLIAGLTADEVAELFEAEAAFEKYRDALPRSADEDTELQLRMAETEALLDELEKGDEELKRLRDTEPTKVLALETELNEKRITLAKNNPIGAEPFDTGALSETDRQALTAAVRTGLELLLARVQTARREIEAEQQRISSLSEAEKLKAMEAFEPRQAAFAQELRAIRSQLQATRVV